MWSAILTLTFKFVALVVVYVTGAFTGEAGRRNGQNECSTQR